MDIKNTGDFTTITLDTGHSVLYDATKLRRQTGNDQARMVAQIIADAIASLVIPAAPMVKNPWKPAPKTAQHIKTEDESGNYVPSGASQGED